MPKLHCDMTKDCDKTVTHIDNKGYTYCTFHGIARKWYTSCRKMTSVEIVKLEVGQTIPYSTIRYTV